MILDRRSEDRMTCLQIVQCLQLFNIVSSRGPQPTCTSKPPRHSCDPCLIAVASRPTTQIKVHTARQVREAGGWEIPICAAHSCPSVPPLEATMTNPLPILAILKPIPSHLPCPYPCLHCPYPCLAHILAYLAHILAWSTNIGCHVWLGRV